MGAMTGSGREVPPGARRGDRWLIRLPRGMHLSRISLITSPMAAFLPDLRAREATP